MHTTPHPTTNPVPVPSPGLVPVPDVPWIVDGPAAQGDVLALPWHLSVAPATRAAVIAAGQPVLPTGRTVLVGRTHCHTIHTIPTPAARWTPTRPEALTLGVLVVPPEGWAVLGHPDHRDLHLGPGVWVLRRQRIQPLTTPRPALAPALELAPAAWTD